jgi:succinate-acetate transporter protein
MAPETELKISNPGVVGLAGFAMSTFLLQMVNLGWMDMGPIILICFFYGGLAELIAGFLEFRTGNNFNFCIFTGFGVFWIVLGFILMLGSGPFVQAYPNLAVGKTGVPWFLLGWSIFAYMFFIPSLKAHTALIVIIFCLATGLLFLALDGFFGLAAIKFLGILLLLGAAVFAWYLMCHVFFADFGIKLPLGPAWMK